MKSAIMFGFITGNLIFGFSTCVLADSTDIVVEDAWARASIGTKRPGAAYMALHNTGSITVTLKGLKTPLAMMSEIHQTTTNANGVSSMAPTGDIIIKAGETVSLEPGGLHTMLMRLQTPMVEGESFSLTLIFADGGTVTADVPIFGFAARGPDG